MPYKTITLSQEAISFAQEYANQTGRTLSKFIDWLIKQFKLKLNKKDFER